MPMLNCETPSTLTGIMSVPAVLLIFKLFHVTILLCVLPNGACDLFRIYVHVVPRNKEHILDNVNVEEVLCYRVAGFLLTCR